MRLSLDKAWKRCLPMWRWIVEQYISGATETVEALKQEWFDTHEPDVDLSTNCYFCEYAEQSQKQHPRKTACQCCPGALVDRKFCCDNSAYDYEREPVKFLAKLESMNRTRLARLAKRKKGKS